MQGSPMIRVEASVGWGLSFSALGLESGNHGMASSSIGDAQSHEHFSTLRIPFWGACILKVMVYRSLSWHPLISGNHDIAVELNF